MTTYFNHVRALETATGLSSNEGEGALHHMSAQRVNWPNCAIGKPNKKENTFEFDEDMLSKLKLTESEVRMHLRKVN